MPRHRFRQITAGVGQRSRVGGAVWRARRDGQPEASRGREEASPLVARHLLAVKQNDVID